MKYVLPPPPGRFVQLSSHRLHYEQDLGCGGKPMVMIHGLLASSYVWGKCRDKIASHFQLYLPDLLGHGYSDKSDQFSMTMSDQAEVIKLFFDTVGIERGFLVGQSMGGAVAIHFAAKYPERVERLMLVDPVCYPFSMPIKGKLAITPGLGAVLMSNVYNRSILEAHKRYDVVFDPDTMSDEEVDLMYAHMDSPPARRAVYRALVAIAKKKGLSDAVKKIKQPTMILWGDQDTLVPTALSARLEREISGSKLQIITGCGHAPMTEQPDLFARRVIDFFS